MGFVLSSKFLYLDGVELTYQLFNIYSLIRASDYLYVDPNSVKILKIYPL